MLNARANIPALLASPNMGMDVPHSALPIAPQRDATPDPAFLWGQGGQRMSPERNAAEREIATELMRSNFSPVAHWTQGLGRVADSVTGALMGRKLDKADAANADHASEVVRALANGSLDNNQMAAIVADPNLPQATREAVKLSSDRWWEANKPQYFAGDADRVSFNPMTGESNVIYDAEEPFEEYASSLGLQPGTPEYFAAAEDYVLRGNGPTALQYDKDIDDYRTGNRLEVEGARQSNRLDLEGVRQRHRITTKGTPTYRDANPRPAAPRAGGSKRPTATGPNGQKVEWDGKAWVPAR